MLHVLHNLHFKMTFLIPLYYLIEVPNTFCETSKSLQKIHATFNIWSCSSILLGHLGVSSICTSLYNMYVLEMFLKKFNVFGNVQLLSNKLIEENIFIIIFRVDFYFISSPWKAFCG